MLRPLLIFVIAILSLPIMSQNFADDWKNIDRLNKEGKYRSALTAAEKLFTKAGDAAVVDVQLKALFHRVQYTQQLEEEGQEKAIALVRAEIATNQDPVFRAVADHLLGKMLFAYANENGRNRSDRTAEAELDADWEKPLSEWSLNALYKTGTEYLLAALEQAQQQKTALSELDAIINEGENLGDRVPNLYAALVHATLDELGTGYANLPEPTYVFSPESELLFSAIDPFSKAEVDTRDTEGLSYRRLKLYQALLAEQSNDRKQRAALVHTNLRRLEWAHQLTNDEAAYEQALKQFYQRAKDYPGAGMILMARAQLQLNYPKLNNGGDDENEFHQVRALQLAEKVLADHPNSQAAEQARLMVEQIKRPNLSARVEEYLLPNQANLFYLSYRNVEQLHYSIYAEPFEPAGENRYNRSEDIRLKIRQQALHRGTIELSTNDDYNNHGTEMVLPALDPGQYTIFLSTSPDYNENEGITLVKSLAVSGLATIVLDEAEGTELLVVDRNSGAPVADAQVKLYENYGRNRDQLGSPTLFRTNAQGKIALPQPPSRYYNWLVVVEKGEDKMATSISVNNNVRTDRQRNRVHFFLDRGLYRPGQTLYAKGLAVTYDTDGIPTLAKNTSQQVVLRDANGQEVGQQEVSTDAYGAFNVSFQLPESGLNGRYILMSTFGGSSSFRVEAYKRPRFEVTFEDYEGAIEAGQEITVTGEALGFAGPPVSGGRVTYRVVRETVRYWYFFGGGGNDPEAVLTTGQTTTDDDGTFSITFTAKTPLNESAPSWRRPSYRFVVYADVADQTGETHAGQTAVSLRSKVPAVGIDAPELVDKQKVIGTEISLSFKPSDSETPTLAAIVSVQAIRNPNPALVERYWPVPDRPIISKAEFSEQFPRYAYGENRPMEQWPLRRSVAVPGDRTIILGEVDNFTLPTNELPVGFYRITLTYPDGEGGEAKTLGHFAVYDGATGQLPAGKSHILLPGDQTVAPGATARLQLLTQSTPAQLLYRWQSRNLDTGNKAVKAPSQPLTFDHQVTNDDRGGLQFNLLYVQHNRLHNFSQTFVIPWPTKELELSYETFRDKLRPGEEEQWTIRVKDHEGRPVSAQMLASMYDASLDAIAGFSWSGEVGFYPNGFYRRAPYRSSDFNQASSYGRYAKDGYRVQRNYQLPSFDFSPIRFGFSRYPEPYMVMEQMEMAEDEAQPRMRSSAPPPPPPPPGATMQSYGKSAAANEAAPVEAPVNIRTNLNETAFFQPAIRVSKNGEATINFTSPEALTKWKLQLLAHTPELAYAYDTREIVTQKELMILPNAPRFMREGDELVFTAKVSNLSDQSMSGAATLEFFDPETEEILTSEVARVALKLEGTSKVPSNSGAAFQLEPGKSETVSFRLKVSPNSAGLIGYRVIARAGEFSDGEQNVLPILTNRVFLTATKSFFLRPNQQKTVELEALVNSEQASGNVINQGYTFELTNNPAWLAVKALPYLTEYPYDCTEQLVNRFFANQLSYTIVQDKPELQKVYASWQADPDALKSPLALDQNLKQAILEETPWLREAQSEEEQREQIATLFDLNRIAKEQENTLAKLENRQRADGSFSWFPDGPENVYMTQYVVEALLRLQTLQALEASTADRTDRLARKTLQFLDESWVERYQKLLERNKKSIADDFLPATSLVHYLYVRSHYLQDNPLNAEAQKMWNFYYGRAKDNWTDYGLYEQALLAATYARVEAAMGKLIIESLRERALSSEAFGMYWKYPPGWGWQQLPVETHCRIFEAFLLNGGTEKELDEMRLYLLQDKRTNRWETTKATAAAVHALLLNGTDWLANETQVKVSIPGVAADRIVEAQRQAEAGTGQYQIAIAADQVQADMGKVKLNNDKQTVAWGGMYWQFTQDIDAVQQQNEAGPLGLSRKIFRRVNTDEGVRLVPVDADNPVQPGDRLVVQLTIRADRNFEYVHLKDRRASGLEPTEQLSGYQYRGGLGFYFSPDDLAVNFFFDYLPKGTHTLEYDLFVNHAGDFSNGLSVVQSMYAPEFAGYSEGSRILVR